MFNVVSAATLDPERDALLCLPQEGQGSKQSFFRVPVRSSVTTTADEQQRIRVTLVPGCSGVVQHPRGLRRLLIRFPMSYVPRVNTFDNNDGGERAANLSMGFALFDSMVGPTAEQTTIMRNIDALAQWIRLTMLRCDRIRVPLKLTGTAGGGTFTHEQAIVAADMMHDVFVAKQLESPPPSAPPAGMGGKAPSAGGRGGSAVETGSGARPRARYCYVKLVSPHGNAPEIFHSYFYTPAGKPIPFNTVVAWQNFHAEPFVEVEEVFVSKAVKCLQMKLRECIVTPPMERAQRRFSVAFPEVVCKSTEEPSPDEEEEVPVEKEEEPPAKRVQLSDTTKEALRRCMDAADDDEEEEDRNVEDGSSTVAVAPAVGGAEEQ